MLQTFFRVIMLHKFAKVINHLNPQLCTRNVKHSVEPAHFLHYVPSCITAVLKCMQGKNKHVFCPRPKMYHLVYHYRSLAALLNAFVLKMSSNKMKQLSKEQLLEAVRKKRECNARAQRIVESLIEPANETNDFLSKLKDINQCHYDDIVDERSILLLCGYPLCLNNLTNVPAQKYQISTATNKVYDITDRKKFCSTKCFKSSEYIKSQMLTSPLWLRNYETMPEFKVFEM